MTQQVDFMREHLMMECKRLRALGLTTTDIEAKLSVSPHLIHEIVMEEFYPRQVGKPVGLPDRAGAILHIRGK